MVRGADLTTAAPEVDALELIGDYRRRISDALYVSLKKGAERVPLIPNEIQSEYLDATCYSPYMHGIDGDLIPQSPWTHEPFSFRNLILKPRQVGMSTIVLARKLMRVVTEPNLNLLIIAQDDPMKAEFRERVHAYLEDLENAGQCPPYGSRAGRGKLDNEDRLDTGINSTIYFQSAQSPNIGRTVTFHMAYGTELAFWDNWGEGNARRIVHALNSAVPDPPYGEIDFESTPNGPAGAFFDLCMSALEGKITEIGGGKAWKLFFWPWWAQQEYRITNSTLKKSDLDDHERWLFGEFGVQLDQLDWRRAKITEAEALKQHFDQEYPEDPMTCFITGQQTVLKKKTISRMRKQVLDFEPLNTEMGGDLRFYEGPQPGISYIMGMDGSQGNPGDDESGMVVCRTDNMRPVVCYNGYITPHDFARLGARIGFEYYRAYAVAESNNDVGYALNKGLDDLQYPNMHYRQNPEADVRSGVKVNPFSFGWQTNVKTRPEMIDTFQQWMEGNLVTLPDKPLVNQAATLIWRAPKGNPGGKKRAEAAPSAKDDLLFSYLICLAARDYATDVNNRAGPVRL